MRPRRMLLAFPLPLFFLLALGGCSRAQVSPQTQPGSAAGTSPGRLAKPNKPIAQIIGRSGVDREQVSLLVDKSDRLLTVYYGGRSIKTYPIVLGTNPVDNKLREGDGCTPEGVFRIRDLYPHRSWSVFLWLDYPTDDSWAKHRAAKREGTIPQDASIGGEIGVHGVPAGSDRLIDERSDWTLGCISMKNAHVNELYGIVKRGTRVTIVH